MARINTRPVNPDKAFRKGLSELRGVDLPAVREAISRILGITTNASFCNYASGRTKNLDVDKARQIEALFADYGVLNPWGL